MLGEPRVQKLREEDADRSVDIGARVKAFRTDRRMTLRQLADAVQTTASFISQFERGLSGANTSTLMRIANALGVSISDLFEDSSIEPHHVLRRARRPALPVSEGYRKTLLSRRPVREFEVYAGEFAPGGSTGSVPYTHGDSREMFLVLRGEVELTVGNVSHRLKEGDCIEYPTSTPHKTRNIGAEAAEVLWIISPPTSRVSELDQYSPGDMLAAGKSDESGSQQKGNGHHGKNSV